MVASESVSGEKKIASVSSPRTLTSWPRTLTSKQLDIADIRHLARFCYIRDERLDLTERHAVQAISIAKLNRAETNAGD